MRNIHDIDSASESLEHAHDAACINSQADLLIVFSVLLPSGTYQLVNKRQL